jgi:hypothetical protein
MSKDIIYWIGEASCYPKTCTSYGTLILNGLRSKIEGLEYNEFLKVREYVKRIKNNLPKDFLEFIEEIYNETKEKIKERLNLNL